MSEDLSKDYIKALIDLAEEDKKSVLLYVAFDLSVVSLTLSEKVFQGAQAHSLVVAAGLVLLLLSATLFFHYYRTRHLATFALVEQLLTLDVQAARQIPKDNWRRQKVAYRIGYSVRAAGIAVLIAAYLMPRVAGVG